MQQSTLLLPAAFATNPCPLPPPPPPPQLLLPLPPGRHHRHRHHRHLKVRQEDFGGAPPPSAHFQLFGGNKRFLLSKLNTITSLTITLKWSVAMMEIFLSLKKYPALCKLKSLGAS
jgi:hypothetical protein